MSFWHKTPSVNLMIYALRQLKCKVVFAGICDFEFVPPSPLRPESNPTIRLSPHVSESYVVAPLPWDQMPTVLYIYIYIYIYILYIIMINKKNIFLSVIFICQERMKSLEIALVENHMTNFFVGAMKTPF
jgi:hypothetical protein